MKFLPPSNHADGAPVWNTQRLCPRCIVADPLYQSVTVDTRSHYCLTPKHVQDLPQM